MTQRFKRNVLSNAGASAAGAAVQFTLVLVLARWLEVDEFASFLTAVALIGVAEMASDFGARIFATRQFSLGERIQSTFFTAVAAKTFYSIILAIIVLLLPWQLLSSFEVGLCVLIAILQPSTDPFLWYLRGRERLDIEAGVVLVWRILSALLVCGLAWLGFDIVYLLLGWLFASVVRIGVEACLGDISGLLQGRFVNRVILSWRDVLKIIRVVFPIGIAFFLMALYQRMGVFTLGIVGESLDVALFGAAFTLVASAGFVATSITVSSFPALARAVEKQEYEEASKVVRRKLSLITLLFVPGCFVGVIVTPWVVGLVYPDSYQSASTAMISLLPGLYISVVNFALKYLLNALHLNWVDAASVVVGLVVFLVVLLLPNWEHWMYGAAVAWCSGEMCIFLLKWFVLNRDERLSGINLGVYLSVFFLLWLYAFLVEGYIQEIYTSLGRMVGSVV